jgi:hypothetical protein
LEVGLVDGVVPLEGFAADTLPAQPVAASKTPKANEKIKVGGTTLLLNTKVM